MTDVWLRQSLKTAGGEVNDIMWSKQCIGTMTLVYREADRLAGAIQLEQTTLPHNAKRQVFSFLQAHTQSLTHALGVKECNVVVTHSDYDHIIAADDEPSDFVNVEEDYDYDYDWMENERFEDEGAAEQNEYTMGQHESDAADDAVFHQADEADGYYELILVSESRNLAEYQIYDEEQELIAEAKIRIDGRDISGTINWMLEPEEDEIEIITELLVSDFDEDKVDSFVLHIQWDREIIETIELTHEDLFKDEDELTNIAAAENVDEQDYTAVLTREDGDTLTYDIYQQSYGGLPIGTATIDISYRQLKGYIDFREPGSSEDRENIATLIMQEVDREKDFDTFNLTMLFQNQPFEEFSYEVDQVH
jgi:hypothetical protein